MNHLHKEPMPDSISDGEQFEEGPEPELDDDLDFTTQRADEIANPSLEKLWKEEKK